MVATARNSRNDAWIDVGPAAVSDILKVLARHNPKVSKAALEAAGKVMAAISAATAHLSAEQRRDLLAHENELTIAMENVVADLTAKRGKLVALHADKPVEISKGSGLGKLVDIEEGRRRLADYATVERLEDWAGTVAGPSEIEKRFGTKRSTLHDWQKRGAIIGLLKGERKHVFPLAQFVDGRPVEGMSEITKIIRNQRAAWQWLIQSKPSIGGSPLDALKSGHINDVIEAAERDFG